MLDKEMEALRYEVLTLLRPYKNAIPSNQVLYGHSGMRWRIKGTDLIVEGAQICRFVREEPAMADRISERCPSEYPGWPYIHSVPNYIDWELMTGGRLLLSSSNLFAAPSTVSTARLRSFETNLRKGPSVVEFFFPKEGMTKAEKLSLRMGNEVRDKAERAEYEKALRIHADEQARRLVERTEERTVEPPNPWVIRPVGKVNERSIVLR